MRNYKCTLSLLLLLLLTLTVYADEKRALIVAIGDYPVDGGWHKLSAVNDERIIRESLYLHGFRAENVRSLINQEARKKDIIGALELLIKQTSKGDVVIFHYSGHGQQITDTNGDELDGYDEALIPYDAQKTFTKNYKGENHFIDDELNMYVHLLRKKAGETGDVLVFLDACHSGTATRGLIDKAIFRGSIDKFELEGSKTNRSLTAYQLFDEQDIFKNVNSIMLSPYAIISASGQQELNIEIEANGKRYGSLSYAIAESLNKTSGKLSYLSFFEQIQNSMSTSIRGRHIQTPQFEGQMNRLVFAGKTIDIQRNCRITEIVNSKKVKINMGQLSGLSKSATIAFFDTENYDMNISQAIAIGEVTELGLTESFLKIQTQVNAEEIVNAWGIVTNWVFDDNYNSIEEMRADIIRKTNANNESLNVEFELVPIHANHKKQAGFDFKCGDVFYLKITNKGSKTAFFQIISIQSDNQVFLLFDPSRLTPNELVIGPGTTKLLERYPIKVVPPAGLEMYKLVASEQQLDLSPIITQRFTDNRSLSHTGFEQLINELYNTDNTNRTYPTNSGINIYSRTFSIKE